LARVEHSKVSVCWGVFIQNAITLEIQRAKLNIDNPNCRAETPQVLKRVFQLLLCLLTALHLCGGPLGVAQLVAWGQMIRDYSQNKGLVEAVKDTFDGDHPCALCCKISKEKQNEQKQNPLPLEKSEKLSKWLGLLPTMELPAPVWTSICGEHVFTAPLSHLSQCGISPATPPPRSLA